MERRDFPAAVELDVQVEKFSEQQAFAELREHVEADYEVPDHARNMHTPEGRQMGRKKETEKGIKHFLEIGSKLHHEVKLERHALYVRGYEWYKYMDLQRGQSRSSGQRQPRSRPAQRAPVARSVQPASIRLPTVDIKELSRVANTRKVTCGGKPMSFFATYKNHRFFFKPSVGTSGQLQLLADTLKPFFNLEQMGVTLVRGNFALKERHRLKDRQYLAPAPLADFIMCPKLEGSQLSKVKDWHKDAGLVRQYVKIGLFRFGTMRFSDFCTANVMLLDGGKHLLSIDECGAGRQKAFGEKPMNVVADYISSHTAQLEAMIQGWRAKVRYYERLLLDIVRQCGFPDSTVAEIQHNIDQLTPKG